MYFGQLILVKKKYLYFLKIVPSKVVFHSNYSINNRDITPLYVLLIYAQFTFYVQEVEHWMKFVWPICQVDFYFISMFFIISKAK